MAEAVLFTLTNDILKLTGSKIFSKIQLVRGASDDLKALKYTVKTIQTMLLDAEKKQWKREQVKLWLMRLKDVLYDAQDLLDDVATEDLRRKVTPGNKMSKAVRFFFSNSNQVAQPYKVAKRIREIRKKLDWIAKDKEFSLVEEHRSEATVAIVRRTTGSFVGKEEIIGRQIDEEKIIKSLLDSSSGERVSVVPIVGMGGIGKTALAQLAYKNNEVTEYFQLKMWACVSDVFDQDLLIKDILKSARNNYKWDPDTKKILRDIDNKSKDELPELLHKVLIEKKYLLVLDDLWNKDHKKWSELQDLLMDGLSGSKILVTTRNQPVVEAMGTKSGIYNLKPLSNDASWDFFKKTAFRDEEDEEESLNEKLKIGRDIVKKCGGVPLAIKTIGNLLYAKKVNEWRYFKKNEFSKIDTFNSEIMKVLEISYNHLQPGLKHCFAYCALFPKDFVFDKQDMIQLWMAQGFIESFGSLDEKELEEIGDAYVSDLLCGSFLEVMEANPYTGEVEMFKMHDLMHDLALKAAGIECKMVNLNKGGIDEDTRHASVDLRGFFNLLKTTTLLEATNLRTFLSLGRPVYLSSNECHRIFSKLRHCRTLKLDRLNVCIPPSFGSQLKHLRFLEVIRNSSIKSLPDSITNLLNLQTLKIARCAKLKTLPKDLRKLVNLRYLSIVKCDLLRHLPSVSKLPSLRTLSLMSLKSLKSDPLQQQSSTTGPFFPSLESLTLCDCRELKVLWRRRRLQVVPPNRIHNSWFSFPKLRSVKIEGCLDLDFVPPFPEVKYLKMDNIKILEQHGLIHHSAPILEEYSLIIRFEPGERYKFIPLSKLNHLHLYRIALETSILETLLKLAKNLKSMVLDRCRLSCEELYLSCQEDERDLDNWSSRQEDEQGFFTKLRVLKISDNRDQDLVALPEWIQHVTSLQSLEILTCGNLRSLPEWIGNFSLLEELELIDCRELEHIPSEIRNLRCLKKLRIRKCPVLDQTCLAGVHGSIDWEDRESYVPSSPMVGMLTSDDDSSDSDWDYPSVPYVRRILSIASLLLRRVRRGRRSGS